MAAYYNEIEPYAAAWLRNLIVAGHIAPGDVDERSIVDVCADDLKGYTQCHFFAGIGGWSYALRLAGFSDDRFVWTGSCPCQPFSGAGKGKAADDERHLWPAWFSLIAECRPAIVFGEQVEAAIGWGWLDAVCADLEAEGYAIGATVLPACGVGAPHIRQRLWFVANADGGDASAERLQRGGQQRQLAEDGGVGELADADQGQRRWVADGEGRQRDGQAAGRIEGDGFAQSGSEPSEPSEPADGGRPFSDATGRGAWDDLEWLPCSDGKARPVESGTFPLAHGLSGRVGRLRAYGNAIVSPLAAEFIRAAL